MSTSAGRPSLDSGAPSTLCGGGCIAAAACSTSVVEPIGLTARFANAHALDVSALALERAIASLEASSPPPLGDAEPLTDAPGAVPLTSG